jgi:hypothetical protein|tara:strand:+ start:1167 stop:1364 length:198 start_codon:yes stop_codon:yes gene_type:complete
MQKQVKKIMKENGLVLIRSKKHLVWEHLDSGLKITTSKTSSDSNALFGVKRNIRQLQRQLAIQKV